MGTCYGFYEAILVFPEGRREGEKTLCDRSERKTKEWGYPEMIILHTYRKRDSRGTFSIATILMSHSPIQTFLHGDDDFDDGDIRVTYFGDLKGNPAVAM